ncbi:glycosyltransferase [Candidatus Uhrbacteria bacterium]|nr:glycosyltransferase [Candidatus Uhrbacteria bacterium]
MKLKMILTIPTWNEALVIEQNIKTLHAACTNFFSEHDWLIEVADNGSTDDTVHRVERLAKEINRVVVRSISQRGKGIAIQTSWLAYRNVCDIFLFLDADLAADVSVLPQIIKPLLMGKADIVCGSRYFPGAHVERSQLRSFLSRFYRLWQKLILRLPVEDAQCGLKAVSKYVVERTIPLLKERAWLLDSELIYLAHQQGLRIQEVPVQWIEQREPNRRSVLSIWRDGWEFIFGVWRIRGR